ncbi:N-alpha-acetyltransferase 20 isoform X4 [Eptesicus fuscus]|uniref:N-alpha-acetyltransferase 20 isoform X4 n=1 Tax=Eptesicus fuscus TaxID=29078 RepID=UPI002403DE70|nr:N-alpha-acetyltransferase 20 isoform X4 [Eptesicus fuscus]
MTSSPGQVVVSCSLQTPGSALEPLCHSQGGLGLPIPWLPKQTASHPCSWQEDQQKGRILKSLRKWKPPRHPLSRDNIFKLSFHTVEYYTAVKTNVMGKAEGSVAREEWHGHVTALSVAPEFRRLGLAAKLMELLEEISERYEESTFQGHGEEIHHTITSSCET